MPKHAKEPDPSPGYVQELNTVVVPTKIDSVKESVRVIDESIEKYPIPPATVTE